MTPARTSAASTASGASAASAGTMPVRPATIPRRTSFERRPIELQRPRRRADVGRDAAHADRIPRQVEVPVAVRGDVAEAAQHDRRRRHARHKRRRAQAQVVLHAVQPRASGANPAVSSTARRPSHSAFTTWSYRSRLRLARDLDVDDRAVLARLRTVHACAQQAANLRVARRGGRARRARAPRDRSAISLVAYAATTRRPSKRSSSCARSMRTGAAR